MKKTIFAILKKTGLGFIKTDRGTAAIEASFILPLFIFAGMMMADIGFAGQGRIELDQALRAGAQVSMINVTDVNEIESATLAALGITASGSKSGDGMCAAGEVCVSVTNTCKCGVTVVGSCTSLCTGSNAPPSSFLEIVASRRHEGMILGDRDVSSQITVQVR